MPPRSAAFLEAAPAAGLNIVVAGGTQAGKPALLNCLGSAIPARERVVVCVEVFELALRLPGSSLACWAAGPMGRIAKLAVG